MSFLISFLFGTAVGIAYALAAVRSPAPPIVALFGLLGIVVGEQGIDWLKASYARLPMITADEDVSHDRDQVQHAGPSQPPSARQPEMLR